MSLSKTWASIGFKTWAGMRQLYTLARLLLHADPCSRLPDVTTLHSSYPMACKGTHPRFWMTHGRCGPTMQPGSSCRAVGMCQASGTHQQRTSTQVCESTRASEQMYSAPCQIHCALLSSAASRSTRSKCDSTIVPTVLPYCPQAQTCWL